jgi:drug/metabolite transporter (DMT)-like permease
MAHSELESQCLSNPPLPFPSHSLYKSRVTANQTRQAYILLTLTTLFWGGNSVAGKMAVGEISPMLLTFVRWALAFAIVLPFALSDLKRDWPLIRKHAPLLFFYGAFGMSVFNMLLYSALTMTSAVSGSIVQAALPAFVYGLNFLFFRTRVSPFQLAGFTVTLIGVLFVATHGDWSRLAALDLNFGDAMVVFAILIYALYTVSLRYKPQLNWKSLIAILSFFAALAALPFAVWEYTRGAAIFPDAKGWTIAAYTAIFPSIMSQLFFIRGVELIGANRAGIFVNLIPIFGTGLAIVILGEALEVYHLWALGLVVAGIWLAERRVGPAGGETRPR